MATHISHAGIPYPIKNARFTLQVPYLDADGDPTDPTTPDTEVSQDGGAFADAAEEVTTISGSNGVGYITLSGAETNNSAVAIAFKVASGPKPTLATLTPRNLPILASGTASAGAAGTLTLASSITYDITGCFLRTTGGTGGGGTGGANNQARRITAYNTSTQVATVTPNWETTPDSTTTYDILCPEGITPGILKALNPTTAGRTLDVSATGEAGLDWANIGSATTTVALTGTSIAATTGSLVTTKAADSGTLTTGTNISGSYTDTASDDNTYWVTAPAAAVGGFGLRQQLTFNLPLGRVPIVIYLKGYWTGSGRVADLYALNERTGVYDKLTNTGTNFASRTTELAYTFTLPRDYADSSGGSFNIVTLEIRSTSTTTTDRMRIDQMLVGHLAEDSSVTISAPSAADIWSYVTRTLTEPGSEPADATAIAETLLDLTDGVETGITVRQALKIIASALSGVLSGAGTSTVTIKAANNSGTTRVTATVDGSGNRSAVTLNV